MREGILSGVEQPSPDSSASSGGYLPAQLRDRVVIMLLFDQIIREEHVIDAWGRWQALREEGSKEPLWRVVAELPQLDGDLIHAEAARVYGFSEVSLRRHVAVRLIERIRSQLSSEVWEQMVELRVLPVDEKARAIGYRPKLIFATHDPTRPEVKRLLRSVFPDRYELGYATEQSLQKLLKEATEVEVRARLAREQEEAPFQAAWMDEETAAEEAPEEATLKKSGLARPTFIRLLEEALVAAIEAGARAVCLCPGEGGHTEIFLQVDDELEEWRTEEQVPGPVLMAAVKTYILEVSQDEPEASHERVIRRWIKGELVRFRLCWCRAGEKLPTEYVVIWVEDE